MIDLLIGLEGVEMARRTVIDREELFETANRLVADGKPVTALSLLEALGGGSLTTIYKHLAAWEATRPTAITATSNSEIPAAVQNAFISTWRVAAQEAAREVQAVKEKTAEEVEAALKQFSGALEAIEKLERESEADAQQIDSLKTRLAETEAALQKSQNESAAHKATAEQARHQVKSQEAELERLHTDLDKERTGRQQEIQRMSAAAEAAQDKAAKQIDSLKKSLSEVESKEQQLEKDRAEAQSKRDDTQRQLEKVEEASSKDRSERDAAIKEAAELRGLAEGLKAQNAELLSRIGRDDKQPEKSRKGSESR